MEVPSFERLIRNIFKKTIVERKSNIVTFKKTRNTTGNNEDIPNGNISTASIIRNIFMITSITQ